MTNANVNWNTSTRRDFLIRTGLASAALSAGILPSSADENKSAAKSTPALIAISLDLEMARNFPRWEDTHWDYEKGNLNDEMKQYAVEAARRVRASGGF